MGKFVTEETSKNYLIKVGSKIISDEGEVTITDIESRYSPYTNEVLTQVFYDFHHYESGRKGSESNSLFNFFRHYILTPEQVEKVRGRFS